jgi:hypothetical protein
MTQFLSTPVDKSLSAIDAWTDIDLSSDVPAGATGAIFRIYNASGIARYFGLRKNGSSDDRFELIRYGAQQHAIIGLDANRKCEGKISSTNIDFYLIGYTEADASFFTNATDKSLSATSAWTDIDLSSDIPVGAVAAIFEVIDTASTSIEFGLRKNGSTDNRHTDLYAGGHTSFVVGVDANRKCEGYIEGTAIDFYLIGYLTNGQAETNAHDRSLGATGSYIDIDESANAPSGATGVFGEIITTAYALWAARKNGTSFDYYKDCKKHAYFMAGLDANRKWEGKIEITAVDFYTLGYFAAGVTTSTKTFTADVILQATKTKTFSTDAILKATDTKTFTSGLIAINRKTKAFTADSILVNRHTKTFTVDTHLTGTVEKTFTVDVILQATKTKTFTVDAFCIKQYTKTLTSDVILQATKTKTFSTDVILQATKTKTFTIDTYVVNQITKTFTTNISIVETAKDRGFYYAKLGSTILTSIEKDSFRITEELNKIPSFEFEIANCSDNRTTIAAGITDVLTIYRRINDVDTLMFTGIINGDAIEYLSLERIRITGYASYIDLNWRFHQHLNSEDMETVDKCFVYSGSYMDKTTAANNDTINDVTITFSNVNDAIYIGQDETFFGMQVKYSTKGVQAANTTVVFEFSEGSSVWSTLDVLDETRQFTQDTGTYYITIPHKPSDWAKETVNSVKKFWIRARLTTGSYSTQPKLDRIKITNVDIYRVYYLDTAADTIMDDVLAGTGYSMDVTDACPSDAISIVAAYETKLRFIAGVANALTWDDSGDKREYQWWIDTSKKVHFKQKRGSTLGDITADLTILNNIEDYFNLSNRLHILGNYDGLNQLRAVIEDTGSQDTHEIREIAVLEERFNNYTPLKEAAQKAMTYTKAPLQKIAATVTTKYWIDNAFEVGDTVTLHKDTWNVDSTAFQIVRADIGPRITNIDMGISQEHLDGLKASLQRQLDITGIRMHGSTTLLQFGPETMNYQRVDATTVYPSKLKIEIPSDVRYIHKVLLSWSIGPFRADVEPDTGATSGHDHTGYTGSSSAHDHTGYTGAGGEHTPSELGEGEHTHTDAGYNTYYTLSGYLLSTKYTGYESVHTHPKGCTGGPDDVADAITDLDYEKYCGDDGGYCIGYDSVTASFAEASHWHLNTGEYTGSGTSHRHDYPLASGTAFDYVRDPITTYVILDTDLDHIHTHALIVAHNDHLVASQAGESLTVATEPGESVTVEYGIHEIAAGTTLELLVNSEVVASSYVGDQTNIRIDGYLSSGNNTVEIRPIVGENGKKGSCTILASGTLFLEAKKF